MADNVDLRAYQTPEVVYEWGRALREAVPTLIHDHAATSPTRPRVLDFVAESNIGRLPALVPLRIARMIASPFTFFRGAAGLMAADLAGSPATGLSAQLCGDAHAANFGLYGTRDGQIVMDINDFDETIVGPWEWDLKRLSASLVLAGREAGVPAKGCIAAAEDAAKSYRRTMRELAEMPFLHSWNALPGSSIVSQARAGELIDDFARAAEKAQRNTSAKMVAKWAEHLEDHEAGTHRHRFIEDPPILTRIDDAQHEAIIDGIEAYCGTLRDSRLQLITRYAVSDVAFRIVGTGSVGLRSYLALLHGNGDEVLVLHVKQARPTALALYLPAPAPRHEGERIVKGARLVQADTDILLGWTTIDGLPYIVRQFRNLKGDIDPTRLQGDHLDDYGRLAGALLARAHSRSLDPRLLAGYFDGDRGLDDAIGRYAVRYADQTEADHAELVEAVQAGDIEADIAPTH